MMQDRQRTHKRPALVSPPRRQKRSNIIAAHIRNLIALNGLVPGDRIPQSWLEAEEMRASRGTVREAMKALETQGLIKTRTGPGGGAFVTALSGDEAMELLSNLFLFAPPSIADIYAMRKLLEPELAAGLAGQLDESDYERLQATIRLYENEPGTADEEFQQRIAELDFHSVLAGLSENQILGFTCIFLQTLLRDKTECRAIYGEPNPELRETGLSYQIRLIRLLRAGDGEAARKLMHDHMQEAERYMLEKARLKKAP